MNVAWMFAQQPTEPFLWLHLSIKKVCVVRLRLVHSAVFAVCRLTCLLRLSLTALFSSAFCSDHLAVLLLLLLLAQAPSLVVCLWRLQAHLLAATL
jgi:hypothetical protein